MIWQKSIAWSSPACSELPTECSGDLTGNHDLAGAAAAVLSRSSDLVFSLVFAALQRGSWSSPDQRGT